MIALALMLVALPLLASCGSSQVDELVITRTYSPIMPSPPCYQKQWDVRDATQALQIYKAVLALPTDTLISGRVIPYSTTYVFKANGTVVLQGAEGHDDGGVVLHNTDRRARLSDTPMILQITGPVTSIPPAPPYQTIACS
jgi:hypothetical protein